MATRIAMHLTQTVASASPPPPVMCDVCRNPMRCAVSASPSQQQEEKEHRPAAHFDCSICLDVCRDPVVTFCGHLFCGPCLHCWLHLHSASKECPVCKANVQGKIVPLYGCGRAEKSMNWAAMIEVPDICHPSPCRSHAPASTSAVMDHDGDDMQTFSEGHAAPSAYAAFFPSILRGGRGSSLRARAGSSILTQQSLRTENEFILHWAFIAFASIASVCFIVC